MRALRGLGLAALLVWPAGPLLAEPDFAALNRALTDRAAIPGYRQTAEAMDRLREMTVRFREADASWRETTQAFDASGVTATGTDGSFLVSGGDRSRGLIDGRTGAVRAIAGGDGQPMRDYHICIA